MPEIKKIWLVTTPQDSKLWGDPALQKTDGSPDKEKILFQFLDPDGYSLNRLVRIYTGTPGSAWEKEDSKIYSDYASAKKDAEARCKKVMSRAPKTAAYSYDRSKIA